MTTTTTTTLGCDLCRGTNPTNVSGDGIRCDGCGLSIYDIPRAAARINAGVNAGHLYVTGDTYHVRDILKAAGARWDGASWAFDLTRISLADADSAVQAARRELSGEAEAERAEAARRDEEDRQAREEARHLQTIRRDLHTDDDGSLVLPRLTPPLRAALEEAGIPLQFSVSGIRIPRPHTDAGRAIVEA